MSFDAGEPTCMSIDGSCWDWYFYFEVPPDHPVRTTEHCRIGDSVKVAKMRRGKYVWLVGKEHASNRANYEKDRWAVEKLKAWLAAR